ncbi:MAG TPA: chromosome segregation protein SMC [Gammaproteobacteria bacterium]|nr:chromosome segregation protein SMC [Gammaproteobacteria bacterium]
MEIRKLNLVAFGPFSDRILLFDQEACGLHIVYGSNEAGKSSALRGLKSLLYNIDERTPDNFLHANDKLRIEGCVRAADGHELTFARRKGRKNTLLSMDGESLNDKALAPFLQGVTQELFEMLFGIDHHALVQGGQEILEQKGEVGQALFSASLGSHALHTVLGQLDEDADGLFRPRGATQTINSALKAYTNLNKEIRDRSLSSREWDERRRALARTTKDLEQIQSELADNRVEVNRLKRIQRVLPKLAQRNELLQKLEALGEVIVLSDDFGERRQKAVTKRETAQAIIQKARSRLDGLQEQFEGLTVRQEVLEQSENIESFHTRLGSHRKAMQDRPHLGAEYKQLLTDAESLLKDVRPDLALADTEVLRPVFAKRQRITELGNQNPVLVSREKQAKSNQRETEERLKDVRKDFQKLTDTGSPETLRRAVVAARKSGDVDSAIQAGRSELTTSQEQCAADLARLTLWNGSLEDVPGMPVPTRENINRFEELYTELDKRAQRLREKQEEMAEALREASRRLDEIQRAGTVPTEEELIKVRTEREQAWQLLRRQWIEGEDVKTEASVIDAERALPDAFEYRVIGADELADRLRREADRVHTKASLLAEQETVKQRAGEIAQQLDECAVEKKQIDTDWEALWSPCEIQPHTPREMRAWLDNLEKLRDRVAQLSTLRQQVSDLEHTCDTQIQLLKKHLQSLGEDGADTASLEAVLLESEEVVGELEEIIRQRATLDKEIKTLERDQESVRAECQAASGELDEWKAQWKEVVEGVGLEGDALPSEAADVIDKLRELFAKQSDAEKLQIRIQAIDEDAESFSGQVGSVVANIAPEFAKLPAEEAVTHLNTLLSESRTGQSRRQQIEEQLQQARQDIQDSEATIQTMTEHLDALCVEAKQDSHADLEEAERKSAEYFRLKAEVGNVEQELLDTGEGATLAELKVEAKDVDPDALPGQIVALTSKIDEELEPRRTVLAETKGREEKELELMDGSDHAAALADQGQSVLASIRSNAERYVRLKLAARILRDEIERYRKENQGPMVKRASEHFAVLTRNSFQELRTGFNEKDEPVLVGIRPDGERVHVEGMSNGTRDQLYLALRLASLEKYMESSDPMPFIVDDILVDFDDERSAAALSALAELAQKTQVILFTHHSRVVEQARKIDGAVHVHDL